MRPGEVSKVWRRRKLLLLAALGAGLGLGRASQRSEAANGDNVVAGNTVTATSTTVISGAVTGGATLRAGNNSSSADANADGVQGYASGQDNSGVLGRNNDLRGVGVFGIAPSGTAVFGDSTAGWGVAGRSSSSYGVRGESTSSFGVYGNSPTGVGVYGNSPSSVGAYGNSTSSYGVLGISQSSNGAVGQTAGANAAGCAGFSGTSGGYAVFGSVPSGPAYAGYFIGPVAVFGSFSVTGAKSAVVPHPDGSNRRLYSLESPESFFEDFGQANLVGGRATVSLDPDFAAVVSTDTYHVFLTPYGDSNGLYVSGRTASGFVVQEQKGGASSLAFSYRIVAKRKDIPGPRLERVTLPRPADLPKPPDPTTLPGVPGVSTTTTSTTTTTSSTTSAATATPTQATSAPVGAPTATPTPTLPAPR